MSVFDFSLNKSGSMEQTFKSATTTKAINEQVNTFLSSTSNPGALLTFFATQYRPLARIAYNWQFNDNIKINTIAEGEALNSKITNFANEVNTISNFITAVLNSVVESSEQAATNVISPNSIRLLSNIGKIRSYMNLTDGREIEYKTYRFYDYDSDYYDLSTIYKTINKYIKYDLSDTIIEPEMVKLINTVDISDKLLEYKTFGEFIFECLNLSDTEPEEICDPIYTTRKNRISIQSAISYYDPNNLCNYDRDRSQNHEFNQSFKDSSVVKHIMKASTDTLDEMYYDKQFTTGKVDNILRHMIYTAINMFHSAFFYDYWKTICAANKLSQASSVKNFINKAISIITIPHEVYLTKQ